MMVDPGTSTSGGARAAPSGDPGSTSMLLIRQWVVVLAVVAGIGGGAAGASMLWMRVRGAPAPGGVPASTGGEVDVPPPPGAILQTGILSVTDAVEAGDGSWVVLDGRSSRWHRISRTGAVELTVGRSGDGPGELRNPTSVALMGDTVLVGMRTAGRVERFHADGRPLDRLDVGVPGCEAGVLRRLVVADRVLHLLQECLDAVSGGSTMDVHRRGPGGSMERVASRPWMDLTGASALRAGRPVLAGGESLLLFGDATEDCLDVLLPPARGGERLCHPDPPRLPLPEEERRRAEEVGARLSARGFALEIPRFGPPFDAVFAVRPAEVVFRSIRTVDRRSLDLLGGGSLEGPAPDGLWSPLTFVGASTLLSAGETMDGTWFLVTRRGS